MKPYLEKGGSAISAAPALQSHKFDLGFKRLIELWPMLSDDDRTELVDHAERLAEGRVIHAL